jgi:hypothetical protein
MCNSRKLLHLALAMLILATLACQVQQAVPQTPALDQTALPPATQPPPAPTTAPAATQFPTVAPLATDTPAVTPGSTLTPTVTVTLPGPATATPSTPAARLEFTENDITFSLSPKRKGDDKVQLTITLHPKGGREPFSFVLDNAITYQGLTATFDWHNCGPGEPHSLVVISGDGQKSKSVGIMFPYDC